jgi:hypothetical protein
MARRILIGDESTDDRAKAPAGARSEVSADPDDGLTVPFGELSELPGFDILRFRVSARPGRLSC